MRENDMSVDKLKAKLQPNRKKVMVSIRMPEDVVEDLKQVAPLLVFLGTSRLCELTLARGYGRIWSD